MSELHDLTALEQGAAIRSGEVSSAELVEHYLERIDRHSERLGAFVTVTAEQAREAAAGPLTTPGPLAGVPTAIKDLNTTRGVRTTYGSAAFAENVGAFDDDLVVRLRDAGLISLGKTNTPEFGSPCYTEPDVAPPAVTPWDTARMAGGSSGGAATAVAGGLVPVAQGSDGGGSIRIPASCCGLFGLKPSRGRISGSPMYGDITGLATAGTLARTVRDAAALLDVMAGRAVGDPYWAPPEAVSFLDACEREPGRLRIGRFSAPVIADTPIDRECLTAWEQASALLADLGHDVEDVVVPVGPDDVGVFKVCWAVLTSLSTVSLPADAPLRPLTRWLGERGATTSAPEFGLALGEMRRVAARVLTALARYDAILSPTLASPPLPVGAIRDDADPAADFDAQARFTPYTSLWNLTGSPAVSLPLHHTPDGLPVGVMLAGRPGAEAALLALSAQVEAAVPWRDHTPPGW